AELHAKREKLVPFNDHLHETAEGELPENYDEIVEELDRDYHVLEDTQASSRKAVPKKKQKQRTPEERKEIKSMKELRKEAYQEIRSMRKELNDGTKEFSRFQKEAEKNQKMLIDENKTLQKEHRVLQKENAQLLKELKKSCEEQKKTLDAQKKNEAFVKNLKKYFDPLKEKEEKLIAESSALKRQAQHIFNRFKELMEVTKSIDKRNDAFRYEIESIKKTDGAASREIEDLKGRYEKLAKDVTETERSFLAVKSQIGEHEKRMKTLEGSRLASTVDALVKELESLKRSELSDRKRIEKIEEKIHILREKLSIRK
ncbi:MAG: hypothetical protein ACOC32_04850, partial [Nanoarchaeota archaeon]